MAGYWRGLCPAVNCDRLMMRNLLSELNYVIHFCVCLIQCIVHLGMAGRNVPLPTVKLVIYVMFISSIKS
jgi:hypothetical protein